MPNPFEFISEIRAMNKDLTNRLDSIIERLDKLIEIEKGREQQWKYVQCAYDPEKVWYGDGK